MSTSGGVSVIGAGASPWNDAVGSPFVLGNGGSTGTLDTNALGRDVVIQVTANASGNTLTWEASEDGATWQSFALAPASSAIPGGLSVNTATAPVIMAGRVPARFFRARITAFVGGTTTVAVGFHATPAMPNIVGVDTELPAAAVLADGATNPTAPSVGANGLLWNGATWDRQKGANGAADGVNGAGNIAAGIWRWNGATWDRERAPVVFKHASAAAAGSTALWTPAAGKKFRLMGYRIIVPVNSAIGGGGVLIVQLLDSATGTGFIADVFCPGASVTTTVGAYDSGNIDLQNGYLSVAANNVLNISLSAAMTAGYTRITVYGTEE